MALVKAFMHVEWALVSDSYHDLLVLFPFHFKMKFISETKSIEFQHYIRNIKWPVFLEVLLRFMKHWCYLKCIEKDSKITNVKILHVVRLEKLLLFPKH